MSVSGARGVGVRGTDCVQELLLPWLGTACSDGALGESGPVSAFRRFRGTPPFCSLVASLLRRLGCVSAAAGCDWLWGAGEL